MDVRVKGGTAGGVALIMVVLVLSALAIIGAPFVISMSLQDKASLYFEGQVIAREAAESARNHAIAHLEQTVYGVEYEAEAEVLDQERPQISYNTGSRASKGPSRRPPRSTRRGTVVRKDRGEEETERQQGSRGTGRRREEEEPDERKDRMPLLPDAFRLSKKGPSPREVDLPPEIHTPELDTVKLPGAGRVTPSGAPLVFSFRDPAGVTAIATVADEQGKININTAPPNLIANLFGVSQLARELGPRETKILLTDASMFRGDADGRTLDGAVVITDPERGITEAVTYRRREGEALADCFRGAYLSLIRDHVYPAGTFVYDLRAWKAGYHKLWARREGGFHPRALTRFDTIEAIREISSWQIASLFVARFRGEGLSAQFLRENGIDQKKLTALGLDPYIFPGDDAGDDPALKKEYEAARKALRAAGIKPDLIQKLRDARGARIVLELAARLEKADKLTADKIEADLARSLSVDARRASRMPKEYLKQALEELAAAYETEGLETILAEDLERVRDAITTSSSLPAEWSEAQVVLDDVSITGPEYMARVPRATELNPGTVIRIRSLSDAGSVEFNEAGTTGKQMPAGGFRFAFPVRSSIKGRDGLVQALQRHPVNVNAASRQVLRAVFTGVRGYEDGQVVTPLEADRLAEYVLAQAKIDGHEAFRGILLAAASAGIIDQNDVLPLMVNAVAPTHNLLRVSTTGLAYAAGDTYTIESRGILRSPAGGEVAHAHVREVVEVSSGRRLSVGLMTQADMADGFYFRDPFLAPGYPESHHQNLLGIPGTRSHLVITRPLLIHRAEFAVPAGDLSTLRLFPSETEVPARLQRFMLGEIYNFRETYDGLELAHGESWTLPTSLNLQGPGQVPAPNPTAGVSTTPLDLTMVPGGIEFWLRMRTYPDSRDEEGNLILVDAGTDVERNRISLLYADQKGEVKLRIRDSSFRDLSVLRTQDTGQYLEITAKRLLDLHTWYHLRIVWDGVFGGGAQLFIDGLPAGTDNLSTELLTAIPEGGQVSAISVRDATKFPQRGVVRIDSELFEYTRSGNTLTIRREPPTAWRPIPHKGTWGAYTGTEERPEEPRKKNSAYVPPPHAEDVLVQQAPQVPSGPPGSDLMRSPWNRRGYTASAHQAGAKVTLHGYSLEMRRKIRLPNDNERQVPDGDASQMVWGQGGRRCADALNAFNFPENVAGIGHFDIDPAEVGGKAEFLVPLFDLNEAYDGPIIAPRELSAVIEGAIPRDASEFFQSVGVCVLGGAGAYLYVKEPLPPAYLAVQARYTREIVKPQTTGLRIVGSYPPQPGGSGNPLAQWNKLRQNRRNWPTVPGRPFFFHNLTQRSLMADGQLDQLYPPTGILEVRGSPSPWEASYRPNYAGQPAMERHPDDTVEWIRYTSLYQGNHQGREFQLFVGRTGANFNFRGYPERHTPGQPDLRKQLDHAAAEPIRLVMELSEGGAGYGDYVTIATKDPNVFEPGLRRVYKVREHEDGRFFVSLLDVGATGQDIPSSPGTYQRRYTRAMNPRLVKFPTWGLPEIPTNAAVLFGDALSAAAGPGRSNAGGVREDEDDDPTGITIDEVRRLRNTVVNHDPTYGPRVRFVMVPLDGGSVAMRQTPDGGQTLTGAIPAGRAISRGSPLDVLVVSVSRERPMPPSIFAQGEEEGLLRIGDEVFFFEDPRSGTGAGGQNRPFEQEGFARLEDTSDERRAFFETFYHKDAGFTQCLRGQFGTPICQSATPAQPGQQQPQAASTVDRERDPLERQRLRSAAGGAIINVTRRLRLIGRGLLGTERKTHGFGAPVAFIPYFAISSITGPITDSGLPVKRADLFARSHGYLLLDSGEPNVPWEVMAHLGPKGDGLLEVPRDEAGRAMLRARFGTQVRAISSQMFAYELPCRHPDRYEPGREGEALAYLQKSWRIPGAYWREISWVERPSRTLRERKADIVVAMRFDGAPEWDEKPTNEPGGLYLFVDEDAKEGVAKTFPIDRVADQLEIRVYFRYPSGALTRLPLNALTDDWKETPILDSLTVEYEKAGAILRHEELPF